MIGGVVLLATGRISGGLPEAPPDRALEGLDGVAVGDLTADQVDDVRIDQALRGYRMEEVDALVDRLAAEIAVRDDLLALRQAEIDQLRGGDGAGD